MKFKSFLIGLAGLLIFNSCDRQRPGNPKVLVFSKTMGFKHSSIPQGISAIYKLGKENTFAVDTTTNAAVFESDSLNQYAAVVFLSTTGNVLDYRQEAGFERYIQSGGGFVGVHAAADTEYDWNWYGRLVGGYFESHPSGTPTADFIIKDRDFAATDFFKDSTWTRTDELYNFKKLNPDVNILMTVDESTYKGGTNGDFHPMSWYHEYDGGRSFYTALGHTEESFEDPLFLKHLLGGIQYAIGENLEPDMEHVTSSFPPKEERFTKVPLVNGEFFEPTEMAVLPDGDVLVAQRRGEVMHYDHASGKLTQVALLDVYHKTLETPGVNAEEGLMGLQKDPQFEKNHWVYLYYAPTGDKWVNRLSRFKFENGEFRLDTEQVILEVESQREICCHTGGSIAFGPDGLLYLSTGDNSTPFNEKGAAYVNNGYAPLNDEPGHEQYDARRSSGNTNDLRGKILRIRVEEDGSYTIPEGNLFPEGTEKTRPEIYTMGHRNPYRISVDPKNGYLYWGDVGPDARVDSLVTRGPMGYDEMNQARKAGNFGWPFFIADNQPYVEYNYATGESGKSFDPARPVNTSRNNTGLEVLPPAQPAYVYYPYGEFGTFPEVGSGGRNAMAGPVYYSDLYQGENSLPEYYDGKVIIYEWMRGWMKAVSLFKDGTFNKMEPFAPNIQLNNLIDMEVGPDGTIYLLEYGTGWFTRNDNSALSYIAYNAGNLAPEISSLDVDKISGQLPLQVRAEVAASDGEGQELSYLWDLGNGEQQQTASPFLEYTYETAGTYKISVQVSDGNGGETASESIKVVAGNTMPEVNITFQGGLPAFYLPGRALEYEVNVSDPDKDQPVNPGDIYVSVDYMQGMDQVNQSLGHQQVSAAITGKALTQGMDCRACHKEQEKSIGPSYSEIAAKYKGDSNAMVYLQKKVVEGGSGVWGEVMMPAHPKLTPEETRQIASYIMSLSGEERKRSLPAKGTIIPERKEPGHHMVITASYTDPGSGNALPLTGVSSVAIPDNSMNMQEKMAGEGLTFVKYGGADLLLIEGKEGWFQLGDADLNGVKAVILALGWQEAPVRAMEVKLRQGSPDGEVLAAGTLQVPQAGEGTALPLGLARPAEGKQSLFVTFSMDEAPESPLVFARIIFQ
ncbi:ThuA domain-containing protein [Zeaxanthinibacter enoshimensis]|uniref:ThuA domain-containing protein n=1 Tax=Zeaxanthinibacter enoshimensis TaxID=392009 RepID=UPI0035666779